LIFVNLICFTYLKRPCFYLEQIFLQILSMWPKWVPQHPPRILTQSSFCFSSETSFPNSTGSPSSRLVLSDSSEWLLRDGFGSNPRILSCHFPGSSINVWFYVSNLWAWIPSTAVQYCNSQTDLSICSESRLLSSLWEREKLII
jgi:hypothetical protein